MDSTSLAEPKLIVKRVTNRHNLILKFQLKFRLDVERLIGLLLVDYVQRK